MQDIPMNRWVHVAITYDPDVKVIRTWIDRGVDRTRYIVRENPLIEWKPGSSISLFIGMKNFRTVGGRVSNIARPLNDVPPFEAYIFQQPYQKNGNLSIVFDHISPKLEFPVEVAVYWENHAGGSKIIDRILLDSPEKKVVQMNPPGWKNAHYSLVLDAYAKNKRIYSKEVRVVNIKPSANARITFDEDHFMRIDGRRIFSIMSHRVPADDFKRVAEMGFNMVGPHEPGVLMSRMTTEDFQKVSKWFEKAAETGLLVIPNAYINTPQIFPNYMKSAELACWYAADEPWGRSLERLRESYNFSKLVSPDVPVYIIQNNTTRVQETAEACDIIGRDPYPIPAVSLRAVADETLQTIELTGNQKPVWISVCQYETKQPTLEQLRCMAYLPIISGATGIGIYSWDDRAPSASGELKGWYVPEHPEDLEILRKVVSELAGMQDILTIANTKMESDNKAIHVTLKQGKDANYVLVANDSRLPEKAVVRTQTVLNGTGTDIHDSSKTLVIKNGAADIELPALGVAVFKLTPSDAGASKSRH